MEGELKKGSLIFLRSILVDLFYIVRSANETEVVARKLDAPPTQWESLPLDKVVKLADEQEKLLPSAFLEAIQEQRKVVFAPPKQGKKKPISLEKMFKRLPKEGIEEILSLLAQTGVEEE
jgi:hypothetical protein